MLVDLAAPFCFTSTRCSVIPSGAVSMVARLSNVWQTIWTISNDSVDHVTSDITCLQRNHRAWSSRRDDLRTDQWKKTLHLILCFHHILMKKGGLSQNFFSCYYKSLVCEDIVTKNVKFLIWPAFISRLPQRHWNVQGNSFCKQRLQWSIWLVWSMNIHF